MFISKPAKPFPLCSSVYQNSSADSEIGLAQKGCQENPDYFKMMGMQMLHCQQQQNEFMLIKLMNLVNNNTVQIMNLHQKILGNQRQVEALCSQVNELGQGSSLPKSPSLKSSSSQIIFEEETGKFWKESTTVDPLVQKLFGRKDYKYRLQLQEALPETLYKERNFNVKVRLVDRQSDKVLNSNIVHLCFAVCDVNGEWVTENRAKENIMKGQTQEELYHGEAAFRKIYSREVSRKHPGGKLNFVVYAKPSLLQFSNSASYLEKNVDCNEIEPLVLRDIVIMSKKF